MEQVKFNKVMEGAYEAYKRSYTYELCECYDTFSYKKNQHFNIV